MGQVYGDSWIRSYSEQDQGNVWLDGLSKVSPEQLKIGILQCEHSHPDWPPTMYQFRKACLECYEYHDIPKVQNALKEACERSHENNKSRLNWSHICVYIAAQETGWYEIRTLPFNKLFSTYNSHYIDVCKRFMNGEDFSKLLPKPEQVETEKTPISEEEIERNIAEARKSLGLIK